MPLDDIITHGPTEALTLPEPYVIAEIGVNHEGSLERAADLIRLAAAGGANAVKFQAYNADRLTLEKSPAYWDLGQEPTTTQHGLFSRYDGWGLYEYEKLRTVAEREGLEFLVTPFDEQTADELRDLVSVWKVASGDIDNHGLISHLAGHGKPMLISTGASETWEIQDALNVCDLWDVPAALMHCVSCYPTADEDANLGAIPAMNLQHPFRVIGYSDHVKPHNDGLRQLQVAWLWGAWILEKHFTDEKGRPGNDHYHAMDIADLLAFRRCVGEIRDLVGPLDKAPLACEEPARKNARRCLVSKHPIAKGETISSADLTAKRPQIGISPANVLQVSGKKAARDIGANEPINYADIEGGEWA